jgi:hypothetical protein
LVTSSAPEMTPVMVRSLAAPPKATLKVRLALRATGVAIVAVAAAASVWMFADSVTVPVPATLPPSRTIGPRVAVSAPMFSWPDGLTVTAPVIWLLLVVTATTSALAPPAPSPMTSGPTIAATAAVLAGVNVPAFTTVLPV